MRFEKGHKAATRQHILEVASKSFRRDGVSAAGIAGIMGEAGLTNGHSIPTSRPRRFWFAKRWRAHLLTSNTASKKISRPAWISRARSVDT